MTRFLFAVLALIVLLAAIVVVAPGLIPVGAFKGRIETAASNALGRPVTIGEGLRFKLVPRTAFHVTALEIANAEGFDAPYLARVKQADIGVKLLPLLRKSIEIDRFVLTEPDINLARAKDGSVNWNIAASEAAPAAESSQAGVRDIRLGDVRIEGGKATYADEAAGKTYTASDIDLVVRLASLAEPLEAEGTLIFEGAPSRIDIVLTSLKNILDKEPANLKLDMKLGETEAGGDFVVETKDGLVYSGPLKLNAPNLPQFVKLTGADLAEAPGFDALSVEGKAAGGANSVRLTDAKIVFDKIDAAGDLGLDWSGARPKAVGNLAASVFDLRPYLPPPSQSATGFPAWSEEKLDFAGLRNIDADLNLTADKIFLNDMELGASRLKLTIAAGRMTADIPELGFYGGGGSGQLVVNAQGASPSITGRFDLGSVEAQPFCTDLLRIDRLLGLGGFNLDFSASGSSQAAIMRSLDGSGRFDVANGAIKGVNFAKLARSIIEIQQGGLNPSAITSAIALAQSPDEQTDFSEFLSQFAITDGLVNAPTISLTGPFVTMTGTGSVNLPAQTLDLRLAPRASTAMDNQSGKSIAVPMRVTGTFSQPKIVIDAEALLKGRAEQGLRDIVGGALGKKQETDPAGEGAADEPAKEKAPEDAARSIFEGVFGQPPAEEEEQKEEEPPPDAGGEAAASQPSPEEAIAEEAVNLIFGPRGAPAPAETAPENEPQ